MRTVLTRFTLTTLPVWVLSLSASEALAAPTPGRTICAQGCDFSTIQSAVSASTPNEVFGLRAEVYTGKVDANGKSLTLVGSSTGVSTIIATGPNVVTAQNTSSLTLWDLTVHSIESGGDGRCMRTKSNSTLTLEHVEVSGCYDKNDGAGVNIESGATLIVRDSLFDDNISSGGGGKSGGHINVSGTLVAERTTFRDGQANGTGGAIRLQAGTSATLTDCVFEGNDAVVSGGAIWATNATLTLTRGSLEGNEAPFGGAIYADSAATLTANGTSFYNNNASGTGGDISADSCTVQLTDNELIGGMATLAGGSLSLTGGSLTATNLSIQGASSGSCGGAINADDTTIDVIGLSTSGNSAVTEGGALCLTDGTAEISSWDSVDDRALAGGGLALTGSSEVTLEGSSFQSDVAEQLQGGAIYASGTAVLGINASSFSDNTANNSVSPTSARGGAIAWDSSKILTISASDFQRNLTTNDGGAIAINLGTAEISGSTFTANEADDTSGAISVLTGSLTLSDTRLEANQAGNSGGHIRVANGKLILSTSTFLSGSAGNNGGAISLLSSAYAELVSSRFADHSAGALGGTLYVAADADVFGLTGIEITNSSATSGGGIYTLSPNVTNLTDVEISGSQATTGQGGALYVANATLGTTSKFTWQGGLASGNSAALQGGAIYADKLAQLNLFDLKLDENIASQQGGAVAAQNLATMTLRGNRLCANGLSSSSPTDKGAAVYSGAVPNQVAQDEAAPYVFRNNVFLHNASDGGSGALTIEGGSADVFQNHFVGNTALLAGDLTTAVPINLRNNLFAYPQASAVSSTNLASTHDYNGYFGLSSGIYTSYVRGTNSITGTDPVLRLYIPAGGCDDQDLSPRVGSPLTDAGDPALNAPPGPIDIGAFDGPSCHQVATYVDVDGDGYGTGAPTLTCTPDLSLAQQGGDCNDAQSTISPGAAEACDGVDNDCDGLIDETDSEGAPVGASRYYRDADGDGFGTESGVGVLACQATAGYVADQTDCDDSNALINPNTSWFLDVDGDGFPGPTTGTSCERPLGAGPASTDCRDDLAAVNPGAQEVCNAYDDDCDGLRNEQDPDLTELEIFYRDADLDGYGSANLALTIEACDQPVGYASNAIDCDDNDAAIHGELTYYRDVDGDGFGEAGAAGTASCTQPPNTSAVNTDCDDNDATLNPLTFWYTDLDRDLFGNPAQPIQACAQPADRVRDNRDCNDDRSDINPNQDEKCDSVDNNCDGDPRANATDQKSWYTDLDGDGRGAANAVAQLACTAPPKTANNTNDCDDNDVLAWTNAPELCDNHDNDCDGTIDENVVDVDWYQDADGDGFGDPADSLSDCSRPTGYVDDNGDCDDTNAAVNPDAEEACNGYDDDCDGGADDDDPQGRPPTVPVWYSDSDGDGTGNLYVASVASCSPPEAAGWVNIGGDCNDNDPAISPLVVETCDGVDENCDVLIDNNASDAVASYFDFDGDGFGDPNTLSFSCDLAPGYVSEPRTDCDDFLATVNPDATELCNGIDDNCSGDVDEGFTPAVYYPDLDGDGDGDPNADSLYTCAPPPNYVESGTDCDDNDAAQSGLDGDQDGTSSCMGDCDDDDDALGAADADDDGWSTCDGDCDDQDSSIYPGATPQPGRDANCDGTLDPEGTARVPSGSFLNADAALTTGAGCACDSRGNAPHALPWFLLIAALSRSRRRPRARHVA